nr:porin [Moraxella osloensis]
MKKLLLATAVATLSVSAAHADPTVYGNVLLTTDYVDGNLTVKKDGDKLIDEDYSTTQLNSTGSSNLTGSRIGFKGAEALTANTDVVYQLEYGVDVDADKGENFRSRDTYIGLSNKQYGTLVAGRLSAIDDNINYAGQTVSLYDTYSTGFSVEAADEETADILGVDEGETVKFLAFWDGNRIDNAFAYFSPSYNGMQFMAMYALDGDRDNSAASLDQEGYGVGVKYEPTNQPFRAGATYIKSSDFSTARVSGAFDVNAATTLGALYQVTDLDEDKNENLFTLSGSYAIPATKWKAYAQGDIVKNMSGLDGLDGSRFVVGGKYGFNAATTGHLYTGYSKIEASEDGFDLDASGFGLGAGLEYKF